MVKEVSDLKIIVDVNSGDNAPEASVIGAVNSIAKNKFKIILCGNKFNIENLFKKNKLSFKNIEIINAPEVIGYDDSPIEAIRDKKSSSIVVGLQSLAENLGDGFISAGNSGALLAGATLIVKRDVGVKRIAFASFIPRLNGISLLVDVGANSDCTSQMLHKFGIMGSDYVKNLLNINSPKVSLLNIGSEDNKGDKLRLETFELLQNDRKINFIGNIEPDKILLENHADVIIADGFSGNVVLKLLEGFNSFYIRIIKSVFNKSIKTKIGAALIKEDFKLAVKKMSYKEYGGVPLLGASKPVFKVHGKSDSYVFKNAINNFSNFIINKINSSNLCL